MLPIRWHARAIDELDAITGYIAQFNPQAAGQLQDIIEASVLPLSENPRLYRQGRVEGTREIVVHPHYIVVYRILTDQIEVVAVMHSAREYP